MQILLGPLEPVTVTPRVLQVLGLSLGNCLKKTTGVGIGPLQLLEEAGELTLREVIKG